MSRTNLEEDARRLLQQTFGYESFRSGQQRVISHVLNGQDTLAIMPTGGGKSICYQIPAMLLQGLTIVISPLISLMKDQVDALNELGIASTYLNSTLSAQEEFARTERIKDGQYKLVYVAPERLENFAFQRLLSSIDISLVAIDEAHCMSQWGHDFRPSYMKIPQWIEQLQPRPNVLALTATATKDVQNDLKAHLAISEDHAVVTGFARTNLSFQVMKGVDKRAFVTRFVNQRKGEPGIIYVSTRKEAEQIASHLEKKSFTCGIYHGGMSDVERATSQEDFLYDRVEMMVATNAFGMGINKSNVRYVIHYNLPKNIEAYYQEAGRAGRDGEKGDCILLFGGQDIRTQQFFIEQSDADATYKQNEFYKLQKMISYCHTESCLQQTILRYFGDDSDEPCGRCSNCLQQGEKQECTKEAQMVFSCIKRTRERFGTMMIAQILTGSTNQKIKQFGLDKLPTYGLMKQQTAKSVQSFIDYLVAEEYLQRTNSEYPTIELTERAVNVLLGNEQVMRRIEPETKEPEELDEVFAVLRELRKELASASGIPPYLVFSDKTLKEMSKYIPQTEEEFGSISGVGEQKKTKYAEAFIQALAPFKDKKPEMDITLRPAKTSSNGSGKKGNHLETATQFLNGLTIQELVNERELSERTILNHLIRAESEGMELNLASLVPEDKREQILQTAERVGAEFLRPIKDELPENYTFEEIRLVIGK
ncbi:DNA helicase RecQ [Alkalihalobacillus sp. FSL W8-0930]